MSERIRGCHKADMTPEQHEEFRKELIRLMDENKLSGTALAEMLGVSNVHISNIRTGVRLPSRELADDIADVFGQTVESMVTPRDELVAQKRAQIGKNLMEKRLTYGFSRKEIAGFLGIEKNVYDEMELGKCSITDWQLDALSRLYADRKQVETVEVIKEVPAKPVVSLETIDKLLSHISEMNIGKDEQRALFRDLSDARTTMLEAELFG